MKKRKQHASDSSSSDSDISPRSIVPSRKRVTMSSSSDSDSSPPRTPVALVNKRKRKSVATSSLDSESSPPGKRKRKRVTTSSSLDSDSSPPHAAAPVQKKQKPATKKKTKKKTKQEQAQENRQKWADERYSPHVFHPPVEIKTALYAHQYYAVEKFFHWFGRALFAGKPGQGKTLPAIYSMARFCFHNYCTFALSALLPFFESFQLGLGYRESLLVIQYAFDLCDKDDWPSRPLMFFAQNVTVMQMANEFVRHTDIPRDVIRIWDKFPSRKKLEVDYPHVFGKAAAATTAATLAAGSTRVQSSGKRRYTVAETQCMLDAIWKDHTYAPWVEILPHSLIVAHSNWIRARGIRCLILDESQFIKHADGATTRVVHQCVRSIPRVILMSGTPMDRPIHMWSQANLLDKTFCPNMEEDFVVPYCNDGRPLQYCANPFTQQEFAITSGYGRRNAKKLHHVLSDRLLVGIKDGSNPRFMPSTDFVERAAHPLFVMGPPEHEGNLRGLFSHMDVRLALGRYPLRLGEMGVVPRPLPALDRILPAHAYKITSHMVHLSIEPSQLYFDALQLARERLTHRFAWLDEPHLTRCASLMVVDEARVHRIELDRAMASLEEAKQKDPDHVQFQLTRLLTEGDKPSASGDGGKRSEKSDDFNTLFNRIQTQSLKYKVVAVCKYMSYFIKTYLKPVASRKVVIFASRMELSNAIVTQLEKELGTPSVVRIHAKVSKAQREKSLDAFRNDPACRAIVLGFKSGGVGLDLSNANYIIRAEICINASDDEQAECRVKRISQQHPEIFSFLLFLRNSMDKIIFDICRAKNDSLDMIVFGERATPLQFDRHIEFASRFAA